MPAFASTFGLVVFRESEWRWVCSGAMARTPNERIPVVRAPNGEFLGATFGGLRRAEPDACGGALASPLLDRIVIDVVADETDESVLWALTSDGRNTENGVFRSVDGGATWAATNTEISTILFERLRLAPSNPDTLYLSGAFPRTEDMPERTAFTFRSTDAGATFESTEFTLLEGERNLFLLGVDPEVETTVYARVVRSVDAYAQPERLVVSYDSGQTWELLLEVAAEITGFAILDGEIFVSAPLLGSYEDPVTREQVIPEMGLWVSEDGGASFERRSELSFNCLGVVEGELWACSSSLQNGPFDVGRSADGGRTFEPVFTLDDLAGPMECADAVVCELEDLDLVRDTGVDVCLSPPCAPMTIPDEAGGGCSVIASQNGDLVMCFAGMALFFIRRRRASSPS